MSTASVTFTRHNAAHGVMWIRGALSMFRAAPFAWLLLAFSYYVLVALVQIGPWSTVGRLVGPVLKPILAVGFLAAAWTQERGGRPRLAHLFAGFKSNLYALVPIGIVFLTGIGAAMLATTLVDGGALLDVLSGARKLSPELLASGVLQLSVLVGLACIVPVVLALWFAPALVVFDDLGAISALVTSMRAAVSNWRSMLTYAMVVITLAGMLPAIALSLLALVNPVLGGTIAFVAMVPYGLTIVATLQISDYVSYRDVFHPNEPQAALAEAR